MFDSKPITINIPPGPYPDCGKKTDLYNDERCQGTLLPKVEPATGVVRCPTSATHTEVWQEGTAVLYWQCNRCGKRV